MHPLVQHELVRQDHLANHPAKLVGGHDLGMVSSLEEMRALLDQLEDQPYPVEVGDKPLGRTSHGRPPTLPDGWLDDPDELVHVELEDAFSGG